MSSSFTEHGAYFGPEARMKDLIVVRLDETDVVKFGANAIYQPIIGDDRGSTPLRTGIQTSEPGYVAPVHSHPYMEVLHILDGVAEAWIDGQDDSADFNRFGQARPGIRCHGAQRGEQEQTEDLLPRASGHIYQGTSVHRGFLRS